MLYGYLLEAFRDHPDRQVRSFLEGLSHASDLMTHTVCQLMSNQRQGKRSSTMIPPPRGTPTRMSDLIPRRLSAT
jgi:hypothetical protein